MHPTDTWHNPLYAITIQNKENYDIPAFPVFGKFL